MGKPTGFIEYERCDLKEIGPKERIKNFDEFHRDIRHTAHMNVLSVRREL